MTFTIEPVPGDNDKGRQWGWTILVDGNPYLRVTAGGTGPCWNLEDHQNGGFDEYDIDTMHVCDLDEFIAALTALRDSNAHKQNVARWA